jgi:hypothetical protein
MRTIADAGLRRAVERLVVARDGDEHTLGRPDLGIYVAVPEPGAVFVTALREGATLDEATARASDAAGTEVDGLDFLSGLDEAGLLAPPDGPDGNPTAGRRIRWIEGVDPRTAGRLFGPLAWTAYAAAACFAAVVLVARPDLRPAFEDVWFLDDPVVSVLAYVPIGLATAAAHEAWHWLAARAIGVPAAFRVSRRAIYLVFETDLTQIVAAPRRHRYGPFLAGMALNGVLLAVALGLRLLYRADALPVPPVVDRLLGVVVLYEMFAIVWQWAAVFLRSDGYAVLANALRCHNLYRATWLTAKDRLWPLTPAEADELAAIGPHDRRVARWFALVYLVGMTAVGWLFLNFSVPVLVSMVLWAANNLAGFAVTSLAFWESAAIVAVLVLQWGALPLIGRRERRLRKQGVLL